MSPHIMSQFSVFTNHVIKTKNHNHSINKVKNLEYDRSLLYKQPCQESGLCCFSFVRYSQKCATQIYRALYGDAMFVPFGGAQIWQPLSGRNICHCVLPLKRKVITLDFRHIEVSASSSASTV